MTWRSNTGCLTLFLSGWGLYDPIVRKILIINLLFASEPPLFVTLPNSNFKN